LALGAGVGDQQRNVGRHRLDVVETGLIERIAYSNAGLAVAPFSIA
jgi:hypothetical protein